MTDNETSEGGDDMTEEYLTEEQVEAVAKRAFHQGVAEITGMSAESWEDQERLRAAGRTWMDVAEMFRDVTRAGPRLVGKLIMLALSILGAWLLAKVPALESLAVKLGLMVVLVGVLFLTGCAGSGEYTKAFTRAKINEGAAISDARADTAVAHVCAAPFGGVVRMARTAPELAYLIQLCGGPSPPVAIGPADYRAGWSQ